MQQFPEGPYSRQTTVLEAMGRYKWLVLFTILVLGGLGFLFGSVRGATYEAVATLVFEEPADLAFLDSPSPPQRQLGQYLAEQEELLTSVATAERAAELARAENPNTELDPDDVYENLDTVSEVETGFAEVSLLASSESDAVLGANSVVLAYEEISLELTTERADAQVAGFDAALQLLEQDLEEVQSEIEPLLPPQHVELDAQLQAALAELVQLGERRKAATTPEESEQIRNELGDLFTELQTSQLYRSLEEQQPELAPLLREEAELLELEQQLLRQRQLVQIERELADTGIVLFSPAREADQLGIGAIPLTVVMAVLGGIVGAFVAYYLALRKQRVSTSRDPEMVLGAPLLTEIPYFADERIRSQLPVDEHPASSVAESFRFLASLIVVRRMQPGRVDSRHVADPTRSFTGAVVYSVVSATVGDGKTTLVANCGLAAARAGNRVLLIDADFSAQQLIELFRQEVPELGITDLVLQRDASDLTRATITVDQSSGGRLDLLGRGSADVNAGTFFRDDSVRGLLDDLRDDYDVIIIDTPPLLQVAYAGLVAQLADEAIVVIRHDSDIAELEELRDRMELIGTKALGYAYNGAPLRRRLTGSEGSVGEEGFAP